MTNQAYLENFVQQCSEVKPEAGDDKFVGWEGLVAVLVYEGLKILLPELKEWVKLGGTVIVMKRMEIRKKLEKYALEKELDFPAAEKAAQNIADNIDEDNIKNIIDAFES